MFLVDGIRFENFLQTVSGKFKLTFIISKPKLLKIQINFFRIFKTYKKYVSLNEMHELKLVVSSKVTAT